MSLFKKIVKLFRIPETQSEETLISVLESKKSYYSAVPKEVNNLYGYGKMPISRSYGKSDDYTYEAEMLYEILNNKKANKNCRNCGSNSFTNYKCDYCKTETK